MKKKLILALSLCAVLVCLFAISISATEYFGDVEIIDLDNDGVSDIDVSKKIKNVIAKGNEDGAPATEDALVKVNCTCAAGSHTFPAYYLCTIDNNVPYELYNFSYDELNTLKEQYCGSTDDYSITSLVAFEFPNGLTSAYNGLFGKQTATNMRFVSFAKCTTMTTARDAAGGYNWFEATNLEAVDFGTTLTKIPTFFCYNCDSLTSVTIPDQVKTIGTFAFQGCATLSTVKIGKNSKLTTIESQSFKNSPQIGAFYIPSGVTTFGYDGSGTSPIDSCTNLYFVNDPDDTTKPEVYYFPSTITAIKGEIFKNCKNLNNVLVFPETITAINNGWAFCGSNAVTIVFLGNVTELCTSGTAWTKLTNIYFCNENDISTESFTYKGSHNFVFCNAEGNITHLQEKTVTTDATCETPAGSFTYCFCGTVMTSDVVEGSVALGHDANGADIHIHYPVITDTNGNEVVNYFANAIHSFVCQREGCGKEVDEVKENTALFTEKGYSKAEASGDAFTYGIKLNKDAEAEYIANGNEITYGFIIGAVPQNATGNIINSDGTTSLETYIQTDFAISKYENFSIYNVRMFGLTEDQKTQAVYCCAYVIDGEEVYYVGEAVTKTAEVVSYASIPATTPPSNDEQNA